MNEQPYKVEHLQDYQGILTHHDARGKFKMELKVEDNPVLEMSVEKIDPSIELEFHYNSGTSTLFFHNTHSCTKIRQEGGCPECKDIMDKFNKFEANRDQLQVGDTFKIKAALIHNKESELPVRVQSFKDYERIEVACTEYWLRLRDTPEGIKKKQKLQEQRLQREQDKKSNQEKARKDAKRRKRKESIQHFFGKRPNLNQIIITVIATTIANQILPLLFRWVISFF